MCPKPKSVQSEIWSFAEKETQSRRHKFRKLKRIQFVPIKIK